MKFRSLLLAAGLCLSWPALAAPQVGYVDMKRVVSDAPAARRAQDNLRLEFAPREQELRTLDGRIKQAQSAIAANSLTWTESQMQQNQRELQRLTAEFQQRRQAFEEDVEVRRNEALKDFLASAQVIIGRIAQASRYEIIFQEAVWANPAIDITDAVIKALGEQAGAAPAK